MESTDFYCCDVKKKEYSPKCQEYLPEYTNKTMLYDHTIRHLVISGGGTLGFSYYGILKESNEMELWKYDNIKTIYGTSIGAILATVICLNYDWNTLDDYLIKRPWQNVFNYDINTLFACVQNNGIFSKTITEKIFQPLLLGKDIPLSINMKEFFTITGIELHIMVTNVNQFNAVDISYKTHPKWLLIDAVHASCSIPLLFTPILLNENLYCDGGFCVNCPVNQCIDNGANPNEIMGINTFAENNEETVMNDFSLFDYIVFLINKILQKITIQPCDDIRCMFILPFDSRSLTNISMVSESNNVRTELIQHGIEACREQIHKFHNT